MRVGIVCPYDLATPGGVQQQCLELAAHLSTRGDDVTLIGPGTTETGLSVGRTITVPANRSRVPITVDPRSVRSTRRALAEVEVVHVHEPLVPLVGWASLSVGAPTVATFHADPARWTRAAYRLLALPGALLLGGVVLTAVSSVASGSIPRRWGDVEVIPNAIDLGSYQLAVARHPHQVVFLGRDDPRKGLDVLLEAWPRVRVAVPAAELVVMGTRRSSAPEGVTYLGRVGEPEKRKTLAASAVFAAPNLGGESFGIVVAEAMAAGCGIVASDLPAFSDVVGGNGILVPPGDVGALAAALIRLLGDPGGTRAMGEGARAGARRFDWGVVAARYRRAYESALERHRITIRGQKE